MKKRGIMALGLLVLVLVISGCGQASRSSGGSSEGSVTKISAEAAHQKIAGGEELVLLDVRTAEEYAEKHIPGAVLLPNEDIGETRPEQLPVLDTEILVYCRSGNRSAQAAEKLAKMGYTQVYDMGGINDWPYETESGAWTESQKNGTLTSFQSYTLNGVAVDETVFANHRVTMLNIWATYCGPCLNEMPDLAKLNSANADKGFQVVGLVSDITQLKDGTFNQDGIQKIRGVVSQTGATYTQILPTSDLVSAVLRNSQYVPNTIFVDAKGNPIGDSYTGARSGDEWQKIIDEKLQEVES
ncbi:MAG: rhodanese-like domain-containing protein [Eubacteriaceae bacterium]|nr:rhodanese-like domain-containing protein [Eubacteriaceae bacterium]MDD4507854.1 rhodanese-like domain-containing protein [Eubacteriaceae bacterium]